MNDKKTLQVKNYPIPAYKKLKKACITKSCNMADIIVPAIDAYLSTSKPQNEK
jgi:hypothetical protein